MKKSFLASAAFACLISLPLLAHAGPARCPSVDSIKSSNELIVYAIDGRYGVAGLLLHFDTPMEWVFKLGPFDSAGPNEGIAKGNELLAQLSGVPIPEKRVTEQGTIFNCEYYVDGIHRAYAYHKQGG